MCFLIQQILNLFLFSYFRIKIKIFFKIHILIKLFFNWASCYIPFSQIGVEMHAFFMHPLPRGLFFFYQEFVLLVWYKQVIYSVTLIWPFLRISNSILPSPTKIEFGPICNPNIICKFRQLSTSWMFFKIFWSGNFKWQEPIMYNIGCTLILNLFTTMSFQWQVLKHFFSFLFFSI